MKFYLVFGIVILVISYVKATNTGPDEACMRDSKATADQIHNTFLGQFADDDKIAKYLLCIARKTGFFDEHDQVHPSGLKPKNPSEVAPDHDEHVQRISECFTKTGDTPEDKALAIYKCMIQKQMDVKDPTN